MVQESDAPILGPAAFPSYLVASNNHNIASGNDSLLDYAKFTAGALVGGYLGANIGQVAIPIPVAGAVIGAAVGAIFGGETARSNGAFMAAALTSGAASFYNTGVELSNWLGNDADKINVQQTLQDFDSDFGAYYRNNTESTDLAGFVAGSLISGAGAIKIYNVGAAALNGAKYGQLGANFSEATGLLIPLQQKYLTSAITQLGENGSAFTIQNANVLKAFALGAAEEAVQGAIASTAVIATMKASPILTDMDAADVAWNILSGALLQGTLGSIIRGAQGYGQIKTGLLAIDRDVKPFSFSLESSEGLNATAKILNWLNTKGDIPLVEGENIALKTRRADELRRNLDNKILTTSRELAGGDDSLGHEFSNIIGTFRNSDEAIAKLLGTEQVARLNIVTRTEKDLMELDRLQRAGKPFDLTKFSETKNKAIRYLSLQGETEGAITAERPVISNLADGLKPGQVIEVKSYGVQAGKDFYKFNAKDVKWEVLGKSSQEVEARYIWANGDWKLPEKDVVLGAKDIPLIEKAYNQGLTGIKIKSPVDSSEYVLNTREDILGYLQQVKFETSQNLLGAKSIALDEASGAISTTEIAKRVNITLGRLEGTGVNTANSTGDFFALQTAAEKYTQRLVAQGKWDESKGIIPSYLRPSVAKLVIDTRAVSDIDGNVLTGMAAVKQQQRLAQIASDNAVAKVVGPELYGQLSTFSEKELISANPYGTGQSFISSANGAYGSIASFAQQIGSTTHKIIDAFQAKTANALTSSLYALKSNQETATGWQAIQSRLRATPEVYYYNPDTQELVLRRVMINAENKAKNLTPQNANVLDASAPDRITLGGDQNLILAIENHVARNGERVENLKTLHGANGQANSLDPRAFYPLPVNTKDYPFFAFVTDPTITGTGRTSMIYAGSEGELSTMISKVKQATPEFRVITKGEGEAFHKAAGDYNRADVISENYIDTALFRKGVSSNYAPKTDPTKVADDVLDWHVQQDRLLARYTISTKYSKEFAELKTLGESFTNQAKSQFSAARIASGEGTANNPYDDYIRTALDITNLQDTPRWAAFNKYLDSKFSQLWDSVSSVWRKGYTEEQAREVNAIFQSYGMKSASYDAQTLASANHTAPRGDLENFIAKANGVLATLQLRLDPMNAYNNVVGSTVLLAPEIKSILNGIKAGNAETVGALAGLKVPGTGDEIFSSTKLYGNAIRNFFSSESLKETYKAQGFLTPRLVEFQSIMEQAALKGTETIKDLNSKWSAIESSFKKIGDVGERLTLNRLGEEYNRFIAADVMRQVTDEAVKQGLMTQNNSLAYINTFVNRTQGNYVASQRPLMFQGAVGQAIGLFQTYQFNLAQQLLRHVAEGDAKTAALALGLQTTIYGMHGLPGFDIINAHVLGTMSGNQNHRDFYDAVYGTAGKEAGDWLMYGMASNTLGLFHPDLKMNAYTRGDINPRYYTVVPTSPGDVPIVNATGKMFSSIKEGISKIADGGAVWPTMLQAIEHSGINRPLAGLAQTLEALGNPTWQSYSTSNKGNVVAANDLFSLANLTRLTGARPLDEAIAVDSGYRLDVYKHKDSENIKALGEAIKTTVIAGNMPSVEEVNSFAERYGRSGGRQDQFNQFFMDVYKKANTSQANELMNHLRSPTAQSMQRIMGGYELRDFRNQ